jgi:heat shock protein HslJ
VNGGARLRPLLVAALLIPAFAACAKSGSSGGGSDPSALTGTVWRLSDESMASLVPAVWPGSQVTIEFKGGQVSGVSACNQYGGSYTADTDGTMKFGPFHSTAMACVPAVGALEHAYMEALGKVTHFSVKGTLTLTGSGKPLTYENAPPTQSVQLVGTQWTLSSIVSGSTVSSIPEGVEATLVLETGGTASGSGGCNQFHGEYQTSGNSLTFGTLASTKKLCPDDVMAVEDPYLSALQDAATYTIVGNALTINNSAGDPILKFTAPIG